MANPTDNFENTRFCPLHFMKDYKVAKNDPDIRGWKVIGSDGARLGKVDDLIVDREQMKVRYLDIDLDDKLVSNNPDHHLLLPIGVAMLDDKEDHVVLPNIDTVSLANFPLYKGGVFSSDYEYLVQRALNAGTPAAATLATTPATPPSADFYQHRNFDENRFYEKRRLISETSSADRPARTDSTISGGSAGAPVDNTIHSIEKLTEMRNNGTITEEEFQVLKKRAIGL